MGIINKNLFKAVTAKFLRDEEGASAIEYALIAAMVAIVLINFITPINTAVTGIFTRIQQELTV